MFLLHSRVVRLRRDSTHVGLVPGQSYVTKLPTAPSPGVLDGPEGSLAENSLAVAHEQDSVVDVVVRTRRVVVYSC